MRALSSLTFALALGLAAGLLGANSTAAAEAVTLHPDSTPEAIHGALAAGGKVTFAPGTYTFQKEIRVRLGEQDLDITATGATFVSDRIDGDMFRFLATPSTKPVNFTWTGGEIDLRNHLLSTTRPFKEIDEDSGDVGERATADAICVRGEDRLNRVTIQGLTVRGSDQTWREARGDSGVFVNNVAEFLVQGCRFYGIRDAAVYISDRPGGKDGTYTIINNYAENCYDAFTGKRGANDVTISNNVSVNNEVGVSLKPADVLVSPHERALLTNNFITGSNRSMQLQNFRNSTIKDNQIYFERGNEDFRLSDNETPVEQLRADNQVRQRLATPSEIAAAKRDLGID